MEDSGRCRTKKMACRLVQPEHREGLNTAANQPNETSFGFDGLATLRPFSPALEIAKVKLGGSTHDATSRGRI